MNKIKFYLLTLFCSFCFVVYAENDTKTVEFVPNTDPILHPGEMVMMPFSEVLSPEGYLKDDVLYVRVNTTSLIY